MMSDTILKDLPSAKELRRALLMASGAVAWLGGAPVANATDCITGVPSFQLDVSAIGAAPVSICQATPVAPALGISGPGSVSDAREERPLGVSGSGDRP